MKTKVCTKCKIEKSLDDFGIQRDTFDGLKTMCKKCRNIIESARRSKPEYKEKMLKYRADNKQQLREKARARDALRLKTNMNYKIKKVLSSRVRGSLKNYEGSKLCSSEELLGCSVPEARIHLEKQFKKGMTWDNHGLKGWHIDHRVPCKNFDLTKESEQRACFHFTNLQPMWAKDNIKKGAKNIYLI